MLANGSNAAVQILLAEDSRVGVQLVNQWLIDGLEITFQLENVDSLADGIEKLGTGEYDLIILDLNLTDSSGIDTFLQMYAIAKGIPIVVLTGVNDEELALSAVRSGAQDYVVKSGYTTNPLARAVQFSIERSKRIRAERELFAAEQVQATLYPHAAPDLPGFDVAGAAFSAAETCGDYFDFIPMANQTLGVVVGDVSGHGLGSALKMTETRAYLHAIMRVRENGVSTADTKLDLAEVLTFTNQLLTREDSVHFVTLFLGSLNPRDRTISFCTAGHRGYLLNTAGDFSYLETDNPILGIFEDMTLTSVPAVQLNSGDLVFVPTDGFEESMDSTDAMFGIERVLDIIRESRHQKARKIIEVVYASAREFSEGASQIDDMTAMVVKVE